MTTWTKQRTWPRERIEASRAAWDAGRFSDEWKPWRHLAAMEAGIIDPPTGTRWDQWDDDLPSERAILIRAIRETPDLLRTAILAPNVRSWSAVIAVLTRGRDVMRERIGAERHEQHDPSPREASRSIADILGVIRDSAP